MAALTAITGALIRSAWRSLRSVGSITGNNLFAVIVLLMAEEPLDRPSSTAVFYLFVGLLYTVPLALELERRIPKARLELWPLSRAQRTVVTAVNLLLNPLLVLAVLFAMLSRHAAVGSALLVAGLLTPPAVLAAEAVQRLIPAGSVRFPRIPRFPGRLGGLIQNHLREFVQALDVYLAALLALGGMAYLHLTPHPDPAARLVMGVLVVILLSTLAQAGGGFDPEATHTRRQLLPISGFDLLLARDTAWLVVTTILILGFDLLPCLAAAAAALAVGHSTAAQRPLEQKRWHFAAGRLGPTGLYQLGAMIAAAAGTSRFGVPGVLATFAVCAGSAWWWGKRISTAA